MRFLKLTLTLLIALLPVRALSQRPPPSPAPTPAPRPAPKPEPRPEPKAEPKPAAKKPEPKPEPLAPVVLESSLALGAASLCVTAKGNLRCAGHFMVPDSSGKVEHASKLLAVKLPERVGSVRMGRDDTICALLVDRTIACWGWSGARKVVRAEGWTGKLVDYAVASRKVMILTSDGLFLGSPSTESSPGRFAVTAQKTAGIPVALAPAAFAFVWIDAAGSLHATDSLLERGVSGPKSNKEAVARLERSYSSQIYCRVLKSKKALCGGEDQAEYLRSATPGTPVLTAVREVSRTKTGRICAVLEDGRLFCGAEGATRKTSNRLEPVLSEVKLPEGGIRGLTASYTLTCVQTNLRPWCIGTANSSTAKRRGAKLLDFSGDEWRPVD